MNNDAGRIPWLLLTVKNGWDEGLLRLISGK
jgi:hypothetical protein